MLQTFAFIAQLVLVLVCLLIGTRKGGIGLGLISGIGLVILVFGFHLKPGEPPVQVMLTILAVIGCASTLQQAGGLDVMMSYAERLLRSKPHRVTLLAPLCTWFLTVLCGTGHVVYTMFPIIADIALQKNIRPERPMAVSSVAAQMGIVASPVSVATVTLAALLSSHAAETGDPAFSIVQILMISIPASLCGVIVAALWSLKRGKDLDKDPEFQKKIADPEQKAYIYGGGSTLLNQEFPKTAYYSVYLFFAGVATVVILGAFPGLRPSFLSDKGELARLSMNLVIQMVMLVVGALIMFISRVDMAKVPSTAVFKAGTTAVFSVFGVAWMTETFFGDHLDQLTHGLTSVVQTAPWAFAIALFLVSKLVNSQAAALTALAPVGLAIGLSPVALIGFFGASYGYFVLPTYPSDLACINFDRSGTTRIGKYVINHSFIIPGLIGVFISCVVGTFLAHLILA
ncbi:anaerobic C4-dicarboxylate transporter [Corynebacterium poyangense]|uniref:Anaerobic C4-dicarboxylate transporter n=1 Tax=Corynebacterium poyangense TaxID=2684405 RepID=A0A7H0SLF0_9CORY|nr:anaerobic C4-dicarboxylate transporter [Corynebacterium poyangense]MBZ8177468.1 anaerobic C4-dicarboxylate transporter [Corynebacterium poyangense]QNQ89375.1 anaerobic C4-dicarboxylate transporter [Corynebacterium poyangense]